MDKPTPNRKQPSLERQKRLWAIPLLVVVLLLLNHHFQWYPWPWLETPTPEKEELESPDIKKPKPTPVADYQKTEDDSHHDLEGTSPLASEQSETPVIEQPKPTPVIDYQKIKDDSHHDLKELVQKRKKDFGLDKSVDMVAKRGEHIRVGKESVPLSLILAEIDTKKKNSERTRQEKKATEQPSEPSIEAGSPAVPPTVSPTKQPVSYYGIYVVRPGDNLWNIHFALLREFFGSRGTVIPPVADEPLGHRSSGVGRILKYAEKMVYIFNLRTKMLSKDLDLLQPQEKIVIFNLTNLNKILAPLTAEQIDTIRFDGQDLLI
jgi:hypothetical protein